MTRRDTFNGPIFIEELVSRIHEICDGIEQNAEIWKIGDEESHFILGPPSIARFDLVDEEYGWPSLVNIDEPVTAEQLTLRRRHHPLLIRGGRPAAIAISQGEYEMFRELEAQQGPETCR